MTTNGEAPGGTASASARQQVLLVADDLFYRHGIAAVGMDDVRDEANVSLRRLYAMFPSKRDLVAAWLEDRHVRWMSWFTTAVADRAAAHENPLVASFDVIGEWVQSPTYRGCAFLNAVAETTEIDDAHRQIVARHKQSLIEHLVELANRHPTRLPPWMPAAIGVLLDGAIAQSAVLNSIEPVLAARQAAQQLLGENP